MRLSAFASVKLTIALMVLIATSILVGAWCPQESQTGFQKVIDTFNGEMALTLRQWGITDIFHSPFFLGLIGLLTVNMIACSVQRVFPKARLIKQKMPFLGEKEIAKFPVTKEAKLRGSADLVFTALSCMLRKEWYSVNVQNGRLTGEWGKISRLAATITHIGLLSLLAGISVTSWTGFNGFKPVPIGGTLNFADSEHSKMWIGKFPSWHVRVEDTRRENYASGDPKQWYTNLSVIDNANGKVLKTQEISVNNPLEYQGVDVYQSSWGLDAIRVAFNGKTTDLPLRQMGGTHAAFMELDENTTMIFSLRGQDKAVRVFAKIKEWKSPKMLAEIPPGFAAKFGDVNIGYVKPLPVTGLQYKSDPGLPITYVAFGIIILGVMLAAIPHRQVWATVLANPDGSSTLFIGGSSKKAKADFERGIDRLVTDLKNKFGEIEGPNPDANDDSDKNGDAGSSSSNSAEASDKNGGDRASTKSELATAQVEREITAGTSG